MREFVSQGLITFKRLNDVSNGVPLCALCHVNFDVSSPVMIFLPTDLDFVVQWEDKDWVRRANLAVQDGEVHARNPLSEEDVRHYSKIHTL